MGGVTLTISGTVAENNIAEAQALLDVYTEGVVLPRDHDLTDHF